MKELTSIIGSAKAISINRQCRLLDVFRSNVYYVPKSESSINLKIMRLMDEYYLNHPTYGVLQMQNYSLIHVKSVDFEINL